MSNRSDLLALTPDDLATLSNRGTVKRAQRELDEVTCEVEECPNGDLVFIWSDGATCRFPSGKSVHEAICSSGLSGISRHIIRSVLAYQRRSAVSVELSPSSVGDSVLSNTSPLISSSVDVPTRVSIQAWDPGTITDEELMARFRKPAIAQARKRFEQGVIVELTRGTKPVARFLDEVIVVRFPVPGDLRYVTADCAESLLPTWVPLSVWAFRELPPDRVGGLLCLQQAELPIPKDHLRLLEGLLGELVCDGISGVAVSWSQRLARLEPQLRDEGLIWPAELVEQLLHQYEMYTKHDARFDPQQSLQLVGELVIRSRAILSGTRAVPQQLIRGSRSDRSSEIAGGRFMGVGLEVRPGPKHTTLRAYLQDVDSGNAVAVERTYADPAPKSGEAVRTYAELAGLALLRGTTLAGIASSQLLLQSGKRTPAGHLVLPRTASSLTTHPQSYQWENLKPPLAVENFEQLRARLECLPPQCLRPRRCTENLHVVALSGADEICFDVAQQRLTARLHDSQGATARLVHPFHSRGRQAFDELKNALEQRCQQLRYISGHIRTTGAGLEIQPICLVFDDGQQRIGIQPWFPNSVFEDAPASEHLPEFDPPPVSPILDYLIRLESQLSEVLLTGLTGTPQNEWDELLRLTNRLGLTRIARSLSTLNEQFSNRPNTLSWKTEPAVREILNLCLYCRLGSD